MHFGNEQMERAYWKQQVDAVRQRMVRVQGIVGALIFGLVFNFGSVIVPNAQDVFAFLLLLIVLLIRPWGLYGRPDAEGH